MCFSATASFTASALLIPGGFYCLRAAFVKDSRYIPIAVIPLAFGIQQSLEGLLWLGLASTYPIAIRFCSLAYLFFPHWFWLFWAPIAVSRVESDPIVKKISLLCAGIGLTYGTLLYFPLLRFQHWLSVETLRGSIDYQTKLIFDPFLSRDLCYLIYVGLIVLPMISSSESKLKVLGGLVFLSATLCYFIYHYAFTSVWCFGAAILSLYLVHIFYTLPVHRVVVVFK